MPMARDLERQDFHVCFDDTQLLLIGAILHGLGVYSYAAFLLSHVAICRNIFSGVTVLGAVVSSSLARLLFSPAFLLVFVHAVFTYILSNECMFTICKLYCDNGPFRARTMAVLAGLRRRTVATFFKAAAIVGGYVVVFWPAFWLLRVPGEVDLPLMLLGGVAYLCQTVCHAAVCRLACAVPVLEDANMRRRLSLNRAAKICTAVLVSGLLDIMSATVAVRKALPSQGMNAALLWKVVVVVVVTLVLQPVVYKIWRKKCRPS